MTWQNTFLLSTTSIQTEVGKEVALTGLRVRVVSPSLLYSKVEPYQADRPSHSKSLESPPLNCICGERIIHASVSKLTMKDYTRYSV